MLKLNYMAFLVVGLGNPGGECEETRHNFGRTTVLTLALSKGEGDFTAWCLDKKHQALIAKGELFGEKVTLVLPETFMNLSGKSIIGLAKGSKQIEKMIVVHDDLDLPLGKIKISFDRGAGGHKGLEAIMRALKSKAFVRIRLGIGSTTSSGKLRKPTGEEAIKKFVLGKLKPAEKTVGQKMIKEAVQAVLTVIESGRERAMGEFNQ